MDLFVSLRLVLIDELAYGFGMRRSQSRQKQRDKKTGGASTRSQRYRQLRHRMTPQKIMTDDRVAALHETALHVLEDLGIKITHQGARDLLVKNGAVIDGDMVRLGREMVEDAIATAPKSMVLKAINPDRDLTLDQNSLIFTPSGGCPNVYDRLRGRRPGDAESYTEMAKLVQSFDVLHKMPVAPEPQDIPLHERHIFTNLIQMTYGDKPLGHYARGQAQTDQNFEMICHGLNLSDDAFKSNIWSSTVINSNSPRLLDDTMAQGLMDYARYQQLTIITPFCLSGAMAPITTEGALVLSHAEALAGITLTQMTNAGAPIAYGSFSSNVDMKSGSPAFGTPEHVRLQIGAGQLARHIGIPWRAAAGSASNATDAQGAAENLMGIWGAIQAGANIILHSTGWLEGGLTVGFEKTITDLEQIQSMAELCQKMEQVELQSVFDDIASVQPGGHFFDTAETMARFAEAFYPPLVADLCNHGTWQDHGGLTAEERATTIWQDCLENYTSPQHSAEIEDRLMPLVDRLKSQGGAAPLT